MRNTEGGVQKHSQVIDPTAVVAFLNSHDIEVRQMTEYAYGVAARNFRVLCADGKDLTVRCDVRRSLAEVQEDRMFSELAREKGLSVPEGPWIEGHVNGIAIVARPSLPGSALPDVLEQSCPPAQRLGRMLQLIHDISPPTMQRPFFYAPMFNGTHARWSEFPSVPFRMADTLAVRALMHEALARVTRIADCQGTLLHCPTSVVHGDFTPANILVWRQELYVIDWEKACVAPAHSDLAQAIFYFSASRPESAKTFIREFFNGYCNGVRINLESLRTWLELYPAFIFLSDAITAASNRRLPSPAFNKKKEAYFLSVSTPRFERFLEIENEVIASLACP